MMQEWYVDWRERRGKAECIFGVVETVDALDVFWLAQGVWLTWLYLWNYSHMMCPCRFLHTSGLVEKIEVVLQGGRLCGWLFREHASTAIWWSYYQLRDSYKAVCRQISKNAVKQHFSLHWSIFYVFGRDFLEKRLVSEELYGPRVFFLLSVRYGPPDTYSQKPWCRFRSERMQVK